MKPKHQKRRMRPVKGIPTPAKLRAKRPGVSVLRSGLLATNTNEPAVRVMMRRRSRKRVTLPTVGGKAP